MNKNLIIIIVIGAAAAYCIWRLMKNIQKQTAIMEAQMEMTMAIAVKTGAVQAVPAGKEKQIKSGKKEKAVEEKPAVSNTEQPPLPPKNTVLTVAHKRLIKLFDDEIPKTASQLRPLYNKVASIQLDAKKFNSLLWNVRNNKKLITYEKLEDSDSVWGKIEWFEVDGENTKLTDEFFNRIKKA